MQKISDFLEKFKNIGQKEKEQKEKIKEIIKNRFNIDIEKKEIDIKDSVIQLKISGPAKATIILNKRIILEEINLIYNKFTEIF